ncbi:MAG: hypothetical protein ACI4TY_03355 [Candidatus Limosilactobacillus intestinavium]
MNFNMAMTTTADLLDAEILAPIIQNKYEDAMVFMPLAAVDRTLEGKDGDILKQPVWKQIEAAQPVAEGAEIPVSKGEQGFTQATVQKFGRGYSFTDEADISRVGNQVAYGTSEISRVIAQYGDTALMNEALKVKNTATIDPTVLGVDELISHFESQSKQQAYTIICSPKTKIWFDKDILDYTRGSEQGANLVLNGAVPGVLGASFYTTKKMKDGQAIVVYSSQDDLEAIKELEEAEKSGKDPKELATINSGQAFKWLVKRDVLVETKREVSNQTNYIYGTQIAAPYVQNPSKILVATINDPSKASK